MQLILRFAVVTVMAAAVAVVWHGSPAIAGKYNEKLNIGDAAPAWKDLPNVVSGKKHSLDELKDKPVVVAFFTCNSCPVVADYEDRVIALAKRYGGKNGKVAFVAINVNRVKEDLPDKMKLRAEKKQYPFPYLYDESQKIAQEYGANFTPEFFVLDRERKIAYMGGLDDNSNPAEVKERYLEPGIEAALRGEKPATAEAPARGCRIRYVRERGK
jgi:thiol-disulfide isomerase/thioredoxin